MPVKVPTAAMFSAPGSGSGDPSRASGLFGNRVDPLANARSDAFRTLKPICVPLMGKPIITPSSYPTTLSSLQTLHSTLQTLHSTLPKRTFNPSLINYTVFPLTHILQRNDTQTIPDRILEVLLRCLGFLIGRWKECEEGMDERAWEEMWVMVSVVLGGSLGGAKEAEKGKTRDLSDETKLAGLDLLHALLDEHQPSSTDAGASGVEDDFEDLALPQFAQCHPSREMLDAIFLDAPPTPTSAAPPRRSLLPILFHTVTTLLALSSPTNSPNTSIHTSSLQLLRTLVDVYLQTKPEILATLMPGMVSTCVRTILDESKSKGLRTTVGVELCGLIADVVRATISDKVLVDQGVLKEKVTSLDQLGEDLLSEEGDEEVISITRPETPSPTQDKPRAFPPLTSQYLAFTSTQLLTSFNSIVPPLLASHSPPIRLAQVNMAHSLLSNCTEALPECHSVLLGALLRSSSDEMPDVYLPAQEALQELLSEDKLRSKLEDSLRSNLSQLPSAILSQSEKKILDTAKLITAIVRVATTTPGVEDVGSFEFFGKLLGPDGGIERWSWPLLGCLELGMDTAYNSSGSKASFAARAWQMASIEGQRLPLLLDNGEDGVFLDGQDKAQRPFPMLHLRHVESREAFKAISDMLQALGEASGSDAFFAMEYFLSIARSKRATPDVARATSALWVVERILSGARKASSDKGFKKRLRKLARSIVTTVVAFDDEDEDMEEDAMNQQPGHPDQEDSMSLTEMKKGIDAVSNLLQRPSRTSSKATAETRRLHLRLHRELLTATSLSLLSLCSEILSSSFRPLLLTSLYVLLSHLGSPFMLVAEYAEVALYRVAYHTGYASPQNLIMDNVDYVINVVSQRMTYKRLSPLAPTVLVSMIALVGEPIVPLVQDIVDDIFDVLDDYHGYEILASTFLAVLDTLLKAMARDSDLYAWQPKVSTSIRMRPPPDPETDFAKLGEWLSSRASLAESALDKMLESAPNQPWGEDKDKAEEPEDPPTGVQSDKEVPPTRAQEVCTQILDKAIFFLTHPSAFIRARVLSLMASGIPVLVIGDRESDVLPIVHRAWPYILNRLKDTEPHVVNEAAALVACLARWVGDFMSRRILEDAWPILNGLLETQKQLDAKSALAKRGPLSAAATEFSVSHRLHLSILRAMLYVVKEVPISEDLLWEMILLFRPFLDARAQPELQKAAVDMYTLMAVRDEDAVWVALKATTGELREESLVYLLQPGLEIEESVRRIVV